MEGVPTEDEQMEGERDSERIQNSFDGNNERKGIDSRPYFVYPICPLYRKHSPCRKKGNKEADDRSNDIEEN